MDTLESLASDECWRLLSTKNLGRLAFLDGERLELLPVNYLVESDSIVFASVPGSKLRSTRTKPDVAFEIDDSDGVAEWSVVVHGVARRINSGPEIEASGIRSLHALTPLDKWNYVRIEPSEITGRRFTRPHTIGDKAH
jgi:nitroimidazol reductase NimA-like FMN-containing flavoprotein (pyridoxamine 5'-phosphate oxidase superfamily)